LKTSGGRDGISAASTAMRRDAIITAIAANLVNLVSRLPQRPQSRARRRRQSLAQRMKRHQIRGKISVRIVATGHATKTAAAKVAATVVQGKTTRTVRAVTATIAIGGKEKAAAATSRAGLRR
jgi:hypothetical protein